MIALDRDTLFPKHRARFGALTQGQVDGLNAIADGLKTDPNISDLRHGAYLLATAWHETARTLQPITERGARAYFNRYDPVLASTSAWRDRARSMGNTAEGDGYKYRGRGYVQITWKSNYDKAGKALNLDLVGQPDLALLPDIAYRIMSLGMCHGWFTGKRLSDYINDTTTHFVNARQIVNGFDRATEIARYAESYLEILRAAHRPAPLPESKPATPIKADDRIDVKTLPLIRGGEPARRLQRMLGVLPDGAIGEETYRAIIDKVTG